MLKNFIFIIYSILSTLFEDFFFKYKEIPIKKNKLLEDGFDTIPLKKRVEIDLNDSKLIPINPYLSKIKLTEAQINDYIKQIFGENGIAEYLFKSTGFKYFITHVTAYQTTHIPKELRNEKFYANHWHRDGPYSKNTHKVIFPLSDISSENGAMRIFKKNESKKFSFYSNLNDQMDQYFEFKSEKFENIFIFNPHLCYHTAGNPKESLTRQQLVFQINPTISWSFSRDIFKTQLYREPKFPLLNFKLINKIKLNIS